MKLAYWRSFKLIAILAFGLVGLAADQGGPAPTPQQLFSIDRAKLTFGGVPSGSTSAVQTFKITSTDKSTVNIRNTVNGEDFSVDPAACSVDAVTICVVTVRFAPKHLHDLKATVTVIGTGPEGTLPSNQTVELEGECTDRCNAGEEFFSRAGLKSFLPALIVVGLFLLGIMVVRWNMVALPNKKLMLSQIAAVRAEAESLKAPSGTAPPSPPAPALDQVASLLDRAEAPFKEGRRWWDKLADYMFWTRGEEMSAWACIHEAEEIMVDLLPQDRVTARLERAESELRKINTPESIFLADRIHGVFNSPAGSAAVSLSRCKALLGEALSIIYDSADRDYTGFMSWQNKAVWLIGCGLLFILCLCAVLQHGVLLLVGGVSGLLSRLSRSLQRADVPTDYGASWTTLFLSPVVGALMGWSGVLLVVIGVRIGVLGAAFNQIDWCNPWNPFALGIAFLMGFSERAFDGILTQLEEKTSAQLKPAPPPVTAPKPAPPAPATGVAPPQTAPDTGAAQPPPAPGAGKNVGKSDAGAAGSGQEVPAGGPPPKPPGKAADEGATGQNPKT